MNIEGLKDKWWRTIVVCAQVMKNELKWKWRHSYVSIQREWSYHPVLVQCRIMFSPKQQSSLHVLLLLTFAILYLCESTMTMSIKVWTPSLVIRTSGCPWPSDTVKSPGFFEKGGEKKKKTPGINPGQPVGKGRRKKKKKKKVKKKPVL